MRAKTIALVASLFFFPSSSKVVAQTVDEFFPSGALSTQESTYAVDGIALGTKIQPLSQTYQQYDCTASEQYAGFIWCKRTQTRHGPRGEFITSSTILHSIDGTIRYVNRAIDPVTWGANGIPDALLRLSNQFAHQPRNLLLSPNRSHAFGIISIWGNLSLEPLDVATMSELALVGEVRRGILVDFIGDFQGSAVQGLPVFRFVGGKGAVLIASLDRRGKGYYRLLAIDVDELPQPAIAMEEADTPKVVVDNETAPAGLEQKISESLWAIGNSNNCNVPRKVYSMSIKNGSVVWRDGKGNLDIEDILFSDTMTLRTITRGSIHLTKSEGEPIGAIWNYLRTAPDRIHVLPSSKNEFDLVRCDRGMNIY